jgi:hypothetical protein
MRLCELGHSFVYGLGYTRVQVLTCSEHSIDDSRCGIEEAGLSGNDKDKASDGIARDVVPARLTKIGSSTIAISSAFALRKP